MRFRPIFGVLVTVSLALPWVCTATGFRDVLNTPAVRTPLASKFLLNGVARAGNRLVCVGQRGHIVFSDDEGKTWAQAKVTVSSDLVAVYFPSPTKGWAVGHYGVVLHSADAGATWTKQLDGRTVGQIMVNYYQGNAPAGLAAGPEARARFLEDVRRFAEDGVSNSVLDVWFGDENTGFIVGAFNLILHTADGGKRWEPWYDRTENPKFLHLYGIRPAGRDLFIVGEQGLVLKLDRKAARFRVLTTPYNGTFFGVAGTAGQAIVYGLRGNAFRSRDSGDTWQKVETGLPVALTGATVTEDGRIVLVSQAGHLLVSVDQGASFRNVALERPTPLAGVAEAPGGGLVLVGVRGVTRAPDATTPAKADEGRR